MIEEQAPLFIEDTPELDINQKIATRFTVSPMTADTEIGYRDVMEMAIRLRPDRLILGELNSDNAFITMRSLSIGSEGLLATVHSDTADEAISSVCQLLALYGVKNIDVASQLFHSKIHVVVYVRRVGDSRLITEIFEPAKQGKKLWTLEL